MCGKMGGDWGHEDEGVLTGHPVHLPNREVRLPREQLWKK